MDDRLTISTFQLFEKYPDADSARRHLEALRWNGKPTCPHCGHDKVTTRHGRREGYFRCHACEKEFTVRTGTVFERSHVPLNKWLYALYIVLTARKGVSSLQLSKQIGVTQKTAWFVLGRIREACRNDDALLKGIVEVDEAFIGGREKAKHESKKLKVGGGAGGKQAVLGMRERGGRTVAKPIGSTARYVLHREIGRHVEIGSAVHTDEFSGYHGLEGAYAHGTVRHKDGQYVGPGDIHVNGIESVWAVLKRSIHGTWHKVSVKHLHRYVDEAAMRLNEGSVKVHTTVRMDALARKAIGRRITYKELIA